MQLHCESNALLYKGEALARLKWWLDSQPLLGLIKNIVMTTTVSTRNVCVCVVFCLSLTHMLMSEVSQTKGDLWWWKICHYSHLSAKHQLNSLSILTECTTSTNLYMVLDTEFYHTLREPRCHCFNQTTAAISYIYNTWQRGVLIFLSVLETE